MALPAGWSARWCCRKPTERARRFFYPISQDQGGDPLRQDRQLSTQLVFLKSRAVLGPVAQKQGRQFEELDKDVSVKVLDNSEVIQVEAHGSTELAAIQTLQAVMDGYLALAGQPSGVAHNLETQLAGARQNSTQLQTRVQELTTAVLAGTATQASLNDARAQLAASLDWEKVIQARIDEVKLTGQVGADAQLLTPPLLAARPGEPAAADRGRNRCAGRLAHRWRDGSGRCRAPDEAVRYRLWPPQR